jgi:hypothetical protein
MDRHFPNFAEITSRIFFHDGNLRMTPFAQRGILFYLLYKCSSGQGYHFFFFSKIARNSPSCPWCKYLLVLQLLSNFKRWYEYPRVPLAHSIDVTYSFNSEGSSSIFSLLPSESLPFPLSPSQTPPPKTRREVDRVRLHVHSILRNSGVQTFELWSRPYIGKPSGGDHPHTSAIWVLAAWLRRVVTDAPTFVIWPYELELKWRYQYSL